MGGEGHARECFIPSDFTAWGHGGGTIGFVGVYGGVVGSYNWHVAAYTSIHTHMRDTYIGTDRLTGPFTHIYRGAWGRAGSPSRQTLSLEAADCRERKSFLEGFSVPRGNFFPRVRGSFRGLSWGSKISQTG